MNRKIKKYGLILIAVIVGAYASTQIKSWIEKLKEVSPIKF